MTTPLIRLRGVGVCVEHPTPLFILRGCDLDIAEGTVTALVGPSGAGKTTLASIIGALQPATEGSYTFAGREVAALAPREGADFRARNVGFVFQHAHLIEDRSAVANVGLGLSHADIPRRDVDERAREALNSVGLGAIADRRAALLSGGERQRVAIARALVKEPRLLIADEPTGALDQATGAAILSLLVDAAATGTTLLIVTHDVRAAELAERTVSIVDGRLAADTGAG